MNINTIIKEIEKIRNQYNKTNEFKIDTIEIETHENEEIEINKIDKISIYENNLRIYNNKTFKKGTLKINIAAVTNKTTGKKYKIVNISNVNIEIKKFYETIFKKITEKNYKIRKIDIAQDFNDFKEKTYTLFKFVFPNAKVYKHGLNLSIGNGIIRIYRKDKENKKHGLQEYKSPVTRIEIEINKNTDINKIYEHFEKFKNSEINKPKKYEYYKNMILLGWGYKLSDSTRRRYSKLITAEKIFNFIRKYRINLIKYQSYIRIIDNYIKIRGLQSP